MTPTSFQLHPAPPSAVPSLTVLCERGEPGAVDSALGYGLKPDAGTLEAAFRRAHEAFLQCNGNPGDCYNEDCSKNFYAWEAVLTKLLNANAKSTNGAIGYAHQIGRGWPEKLQQSAGSCTLL